MNEFVADSVNSDTTGGVVAPVFLWRGAGIVLIGTREGERFVLARGWLRADRLTDVRRWSFLDRRRFSVQVRRLVSEAGNSASLAVAEATRALDWAESAN
jgi:hypothetical protein